jgi:hypothetical protein
MAVVSVSQLPLMRYLKNMKNQQGIIFAISLICMALCLAIITSSCKQHDSIFYQLDISNQWVESKERWMNLSQCKIVYADYLMDGGSIVVSLTSDKELRWNLVFPNKFYYRENVVARVSLSNKFHDEIDIKRDSIEERHLVNLLQLARINKMTIKKGAESVLKSWITDNKETRHINDVRRSDVFVIIRGS